MTAIAKVVSELFMFVLTVISAPSDLKEFRVDCIQHSGIACMGSRLDNREMI